MLSILGFETAMRDQCATPGRFLLNLLQSNNEKVCASLRIARIRLKMPSFSVTNTLKPWPRKGFRKQLPNLNGTAIRFDAPFGGQGPTAPSDASPAYRSDPSAITRRASGFVTRNRHAIRRRISSRRHRQAVISPLSRPAPRSCRHSIPSVRKHRNLERRLHG